MNSLKKRTIWLKSFIGLLCVYCFSAVAAPKADLWSYWQKHDDSNAASIDHQLWQNFLNQYLHEQDLGPSLISYASVDDASRQQLQQYIADLSNLSITHYSKAEQFAYWVNLYNALTVEVVLEHYPVESIMDIDISPGFFSRGPWDKTLIEIEQKPISLNDIEHRILRPIWQDNRIHYVVNCASLSCPELHSQALTASNSEQILQHSAKKYINSASGVTIQGDNKAELSSIYRWYKEDFGDSKDSLKQHLLAYASPELSPKLKLVKRFSYDYDWNLNETKQISKIR